MSGQHHYFCLNRSLVNATKKIKEFISFTVSLTLGSMNVSNVDDNFNMTNFKRCLSKTETSVS